jgi:DNA invertase Pin-like site-specific DNA recombinase
MTCKCGHLRIEHQEIDKAPWVGPCIKCSCNDYKNIGKWYSENAPIVGIYARVSTKDKFQTPENQTLKLREYCKARGWKYKIYIDYASGAKKDRPGLKSIMSDLPQLEGILVLRLDRFGRSLQHLLENLNIIRSQGKFFEAIDQGLRISEKKDPMNDFMLAILGAAAEFERELISERVKDGMARARSQGKVISRGRAERTIKMEKKILELRSMGYTIREIAQRANIPRSTVHGVLSQLRNPKQDTKQGGGINKEMPGMGGGNLPGQEEGT